MTPGAQITELLAQARAALGREQFGAAERHATAALRLDPCAPEAWLVVAQLALTTQNPATALAAASRAVEYAPGMAHSWYLLGRALKLSGDFAGAIDRYQRALALDPRNADYLTSLGVAQRAAGRWDDAVASYRRAIECTPDHAPARHNLANALEARDPRSADASALRAVSRGRLSEEAAALYAQASELRSRGRLADAFVVATDSLRLLPQSVQALILAAQLANELRLSSKAFEFLERAQAASPGDPYPYACAWRAALSKGLVAQARHYAEALLRLQPSPEVRLGTELALPAILESRASIGGIRASYQGALERALEAVPAITDPMGIAGLPAFFLSYHGECNRELQCKAARLVLAAMPWLAQTAHHCARRAPRGPRVRIGMLSKYFYRHSIAKTSTGLIEQLDRDRFEVVAIKLEPGFNDAHTERIRTAADEFVAIEEAASLADAQRRIAALELDVLFYQDIGMDARSYYLSFGRLAPVQCVSYGHPDTTGVPNMDYFVTNSLYERDGAGVDYSEQMYALADLPTLAWYRRPAPRAARGERRAYGLPATGSIYLCPQTLFKIHPDLDRAIRIILERDRSGHVVFIKGAVGEWAETLRQRLRRALPHDVGRVVFIEPVSSEDFPDLLSLADVALDTIHFNGMNSSLEALAVGLPVVTLPTSLQRGRHTQAMYRHMDLDDCIARDIESYADTAVRIATDGALRERVRAAILSRNHKLYEDRRVVREFERFFVDSLHRAGYTHP
ncbi:MAG TPA: tetratricopeptide repeat protein [Steroidobacteraceae bacterium]|nr:tetratricopeptide repeat protein [Steroidobacteraceae bacterium]